jgi:flavin-dependent dehydrogenase
MGTGLGIRRTHLHQALIDRAEQAGATLLWGTRVTGLHPGGVTLDRGAVTCRWVIGADGENSRVRRWAGLDRPDRASRRFGFRRHYQVEPWSDCVEIYWGSGYQIYVTPIGGGEICVVAISRDSHLRLDGALQPFPELFERLRAAPITANERGAISATRKLPRVYRDRVVLVGDASGSVDAITGEGLRLGFEQAAALAEALADQNPAAYAAAHRRLARRPAFMAGLMLMMDRSGWLRRRTLQALAAEPRIFATQLAMHIGAASPRDFVWRSMLPLGRHILTA